jgi:hypothetical protein
MAAIETTLSQTAYDHFFFGKYICFNLMSEQYSPLFVSIVHSSNIFTNLVRLLKSHFGHFHQMNNDSMPPKYTTFDHLVYVARWSPITFEFFYFF